MAFSIGIVGLPNVGKSTTFNALSGAQNAMVANYPFCTIQPNRAVVPLPDERLDALHKLLGVPNKIPATVEFVDIAGLVKGAHKGEGLGNQFLSHIRDTSAILHVVRCFDDPNVVHIQARPEPRADMEIIEVELALADLQTLERKIERLESSVKGDKGQVLILDMCHRLREHLQKGLPAATFSLVSDEKFQALDHELRLLTGKPVIYLANVDERCLSEPNPYLEEVLEIGKEKGIQVVVVCAEIEQELQGMPEVEKAEYLQLAGVEAAGLEQVIRKSFTMLDLISFFTRNENEVRAWNIPRGTPAPKAAGAIHTDFERGFIRAEVIPYDVYVQYGSTAAVKSHGLMRLEGKEYLVQDGDIVYFRFNV